VEPRRLQRLQALANRHLEDGHVARAQQDAAAHLADNGRHGTGLQRRERLRIQAVFIAEGQVVEDVFHRVNAARGHLLGQPRANALDEFDAGGKVKRGWTDGYGAP